MDSAVIQLLVLAGIAIFLILRLRSVLGTRDGFEKPPVAGPGPASKVSRRPDFEVIEGGPDRDITDHVPEKSDSAKALMAMKTVEPSFNVREFLDGARSAYEMILTAFEKGDISDVRGFLDPDVAEAFDAVIADRTERGLTIEGEVMGVRDTTLVEASYDRATDVGQMVVRFVGELTSVVRDSDGQIVEGNPGEIKRQRDVWTFARKMGTGDPNWQLVATGE
ncbi:transporter, Tim44 family [Oceaniovalibus guishaninsula JLT2003]|uniref:Transporter, Tim44 family n=1 Tax=Oceaniovalibus guishaninsula JLT2003 TaxID=1231392 RepID=K2I6T0_9RHOB|nr:Tim44/TimA family putative adaptor protein [Oceaniovalibus guishaninsula]EKE44680.1 transporter, Tim44 family [Oceaniovalibus guishaninsula JLT2003]